jgi:hypothetical protein
MVACWKYYLLKFTSISKVAKLLRGPVRMLQAVAAAPEDDFPADALAHEAQLREPLYNLQERMAGRGAFSVFLGGYVSRGTELVAACSASSFLTAASGFLRLVSAEFPASWQLSVGPPIWF